MSKTQNDPIVEKLNTLIKITMLTAFKEESKEEKILLLSDLGIQNQEIAEILGTTANYVGKVNYEAKKEQNKPKTTGVSKKKTLKKTDSSEKSEHK